MRPLSRSLRSCSRHDASCGGERRYGRVETGVSSETRIFCSRSGSRGGSVSGKSLNWVSNSERRECRREGSAGSMATRRASSAATWSLMEKTATGVRSSVEAVASRLEETWSSRTSLVEKVPARHARRHCLEVSASTSGRVAARTACMSGAGCGRVGRRALGGGSAGGGAGACSDEAGVLWGEVGVLSCEADVAAGREGGGGGAGSGRRVGRDRELAPATPAPCRGGGGVGASCRKTRRPLCETETWRCRVNMMASTL
mmetsp:Transcript_32018/g.73236  ORF Transcript_32018/g.73236 Transcript_32018/m.73236 type:complete len:258 (-) Transcript_32018:374-1147(-)